MTDTGRPGEAHHHRGRFRPRSRQHRGDRRGAGQGLGHARQPARQPRVCRRGITRSRGHAASTTRIGVHLNFSEGTPLTSARAQGLAKAFCADGHFLPVEEFPRYRDRPLGTADAGGGRGARPDRGRVGPAAWPSRISTRTTTCTSRRASRGSSPNIAHELRIPRVRISRNCGLRQGVVRRAHHRIYNAWLTRRGLRAVHYFGIGRRHDLARAPRRSGTKTPPSRS